MRVTGCPPFLTLAIRGHKSFIKSTPGTNKFINKCILKRMRMRLHNKLSSFVRLKPKVFKRLRTVRVSMVLPTPRGIVWTSTLVDLRRLTQVCEGLQNSLNGVLQGMYNERRAIASLLVKAISA